MYVLYLDDSGSASNISETHLVLGGLCVFERQIHWLNQALDGVAAGIDAVDPTSVEFHASEIWSGRTAPWDKMSKVERAAVISGVLATLRDCHGSTSAFACAVHKASWPGQDPMEIAFEQLCSRFDRFLKRVYHQTGEKHRGMIVLDESTYETSLQQLARRFRVLGTRWGVTHNLAEVPLFVDSKASRLIQLADHVAYAVYRRYEAGDSKYHDVFASRFDSADGVLHGLVHSQTLVQSCMCIACVSRRASPLSR